MVRRTTLTSAALLAVLTISGCQTTGGAGTDRKELSARYYDCVLDEATTLILEGMAGRSAVTDAQRNCQNKAYNYTVEVMSELGVSLQHQSFNAKTFMMPELDNSARQTILAYLQKHGAK